MSAGRRRMRGRPAVLASAFVAGLLVAGAVAGGESRAVVPPSAAGGTFAGPMPIGCRSAPGRIVARGPRSRRQVALTFDDGPSSEQTPAILAILDRFHVDATFFEEGRHVAGREELMREILGSGDEIGNHSFDHPHYPGPAELARTDGAIRRATGFEPCLFRPPYGLLDATEETAAEADRLETILWTFDSGDDHHPPPARIVRHVLATAHAGSIILMHDGGHHPQTVTALPAVIRDLLARGFEFDTVTRLLGGRFVYPP